MTFVATTPPQAADAAVAAMYRRRQAAWGYVPNYAKVFCHRPEVLARWGQLLAEIKRPMDKRRFELVTFAAAHELRHSACALAHGKALREFFTDGQIVAIAEGRLDGLLEPVEQQVLGFARRVARDASGVTAGEVQALREHGVTDAEIFDIAAAAAGRAFFTKLLDALGVQADSPFLALEEPLRSALTLGRAIDVQGCLRLPDEEVEADAGTAVSPSRTHGGRNGH
jgi:alkylhydroperoxidase family enzyme